MKKLTKKEKNQAQEEPLGLFLKGSALTLFLIGFFIFLYPFVVDSLNNVIDQARLQTYQREVRQKGEEEQKKRLNSMAKVNQQQREQGLLIGSEKLEDYFSKSFQKKEGKQNQQLNNHLIGAIYIPKINVSLPIFDQTNELFLEKGATLLQGTSYPIGGKSTHAVITGHSGLPEKKLFTDLEKLKIGDQFYIETLGKKLAYEVSQLTIVLPTDVDALAIKEKEDLVTLLTCTPYGINTHRLLVTSKRIPYEEQQAQSAEKRVATYHISRFILLGLICLILLASVSRWCWLKWNQIKSKDFYYSLAFSLFVDGQPKENQLVYLTDWNQQIIMDAQGQPVQQNSDAQGRVLFEQLPGGRYKVIIKEKSNEQIVKASINNYKKLVFVLKVKRFGNYRLKKQNKQFILWKKTKEYHK
ncbi:class C sortase [Enterococcus thailandicus]|uniref:class C sortase n=1 Tax=Enterococcus thailandicus TaxID=417368 RepID=UPI0022EBAC0F|nr:class C sortase [Enterococcus thailandicus]MDA3974039.1 class C sortase [Enterococcus thailandicus]MDA3976799.1 class C sortase [Enterococcus thailandicus]MDA3981493.1 class C sortase [Enterococcus thailandicus]